MKPQTIPLPPETTSPDDINSVLKNSNPLQLKVFMLPLEKYLSCCSSLPGWNCEDTIFPSFINHGFFISDTTLFS